MSYTSYTPRPGTPSRNASFVFDMDELARIKRGIANDFSINHKDSKLEVAQQFEALFIQQMLKLARQSHIESGLWSSDQSKMIDSLGDEQMALNLAAGGGMGLSQALMDLMNANTPTAPDGPEQTAVDGAARGGQASRLPDLRSSPPQEGAVVAKSISELLEMLGKGAQAVADPLGAVTRAISGSGFRIESIKAASEKVAAFVEKVGVAAIAVAQKSELPVELILSQAALESGWGRREILHEDGQKSHNLFGIKATSSWQGRVAHVMTTEYVDGVPRQVMQPFRAYASYEESLQDYVRLLGESPRYQAVRQASNAQQAAIEIQKAGYATDPRYAEKLIAIMAHFRPTA